jgi:hypothetical protein
MHFVNLTNLVAFMVGLKKNIDSGKNCQVICAGQMPSTFMQACRKPGNFHEMDPGTVPECRAFIQLQTDSGISLEKISPT